MYGGKKAKCISLYMYMYLSMYVGRHASFHYLCVHEYSWSCLSHIFWEHENFSGLSVIWLISTKYNEKGEKNNFDKIFRLSWNPT